MKLIKILIFKLSNKMKIPKQNPKSRKTKYSNNKLSTNKETTVDFWKIKTKEKVYIALNLKNKILGQFNKCY